MKVLLIGNYAADGQYSMLHFADALMEGYCSRGIDVRLVSPKPIWGSDGNKWKGYIDKYFIFYKTLKQHLDWADIVHLCDQGNSIYVHYFKKKPHLVTCHDLLALRLSLGELPVGKTGVTGQIYQRLILSGLRKAQNVACVTETTQQDLFRLVKGTADRTRIIYNGLYRPLKRMTPEDCMGYLGERNIPADIPFLLHVGGNQFYKNREGVLRIFHALQQQEKNCGLRLVLAGVPITEAIRQLISQLELSASIFEVICPSDTELQALYSSATALLFPSHYEGFGLPIIEAQACGCPVFTTNRAPMTEVGGDAAIYIDPGRYQEAAQTIMKSLPVLGCHIPKGLNNVARFSTASMIDNYLSLYQQILGSQ